MKLQAVIDKAKAARKNEPEEVKPFPPEWERRFDYETLERLAIRTVDAGMSDSEALRAEGLA